LGTFPEESDEYYQLLADLYVLSERLLDETIRGALIKEILRVAKLSDKESEHYYPRGEAVNIVYRDTTAGSHIRCLMVNFHVAYETTKWFDSTCEAGFVFDVAQSLHIRMGHHGATASVGALRSSALNEGDYLS
jgi:hypothetical protein